MNLLNSLKRWLALDDTPKLEPRTITLSEHKSWGDDIFWSSFDERRLSGWMRERPAVGDIIRAEMRSGHIARFRVTTVKLMSDPPDMFFATVTDLGYEEPMLSQ